MLRIPIVNKFTCSQSQLASMIQLLKNKKTPPIIDYINESNKNPEKNYQEILSLLKNHSNNKIAIKLSSLDVKNDFKMASKFAFYICEIAREKNCKILVDAENVDIQSPITLISDKLIDHFNRDEVLVYKTYQMYRNDTLSMLKKDFMDRDRYMGCKIVRGAYLNEDKNHSFICSSKEETDNNYNSAITFLSENATNKDKIILATHNDKSVDYSLDTLYDFEYAQLLGMNDKLTEKLVNRNKIVYKYLPYGNFVESIPYLLRRLYENYSMLKFI